ncbi:MAG TPA: choice-of-anchor tandem repeat GloVer-containing protein [Rhizomicrobium sp.]|jgi:uncharacterized repeat protein (TIGR03803 family)
MRSALVPFFALCASLNFCPSAFAGTLTPHLLYSFTGSPDGGEPAGAVIRDSQGNLFGTTAGGGIGCVDGCGTVFEVNNKGDEQVLYRFLGGSDGAFPGAAVTEDSAGNLYGTTEGGNGNDSTLFKLTESGQESPLHTFAYQSVNSAPVLDAAGNLYGASQYGGDVNCGYNGNGCGFIYELDSSGRYSVRHTFRKLVDGTTPYFGIVMDAKGTLYGTTSFGGDPNCYQSTCGTVFRLDPDGVYTVLHRFTGKKDGMYPGGITLNAAGNIYGTTGSGADTACYPPLGCGVIYKIDTTGKFSVLFTFTASQVCCGPGSYTPIVDSSGNLYDSMAINGAHNDGYVYELDTKGNFTDLFDYAACGESAYGAQASTLVRDNHGTYYGTMAYGANEPCGDGFGTVFKLTP